MCLKFVNVSFITLSLFKIYLFSYQDKELSKLYYLCGTCHYGGVKNLFSNVCIACIN